MLRKAVVFIPAYRTMVKRLKRGRQTAGLTQADVANKLGRSINWVSKIEACQLKLCPVMLVRMARTCSLRAHELVHRLEEDLSDGDGSS